MTRIGTDYPANLGDHDVLALAHRENRIIITDDRDFGELIVRRSLPHAGVIYLRVDTTKIAVRIARLDQVLAQCADRLHQFLVVTETEIRIWSED